MFDDIGPASRYIRRQMRHVEGWLDPLAAELIAAISAGQTARGDRGAMGEIGVHHGKLWLLLDNLSRRDEVRFAVDVFARQDLNTDISGRGDRVIFEANRRKFGARRSPPIVWERSSLDMDADELAKAVGPVRMFSIDGGHTPECTLNDIRLADAVLAPGGIAILDDVFNAPWPGVMTGFSDYMYSGETNLVPCAVLPNKVILTRPANAHLVASDLTKRFPELVVRRASLFHHEVPIFAETRPSYPMLRAVVRMSPLAPLARAAYRRFVPQPVT